ncbi:MAG: hypothetical protein IT232_08610 [Flavobacteriales bacterium]|nr:hypothetical protein [Flavobacteriales bacterium]
MKSQEKEANSQFVDFEQTPVYVGTLKGFGKIIFDDRENLFLEFDDNKRVGLSAIIKRALRYAKKKFGIEIGDEIKIEFKGKTKTRDGKPLNLFDVSINGKLIDSNFIDADEFFDSILSD